MVQPVLPEILRADTIVPRMGEDVQVVSPQYDHPRDHIAEAELMAELRSYRYGVSNIHESWVLHELASSVTQTQDPTSQYDSLAICTPQEGEYSIVPITITDVGIGGFIIPLSAIVLTHRLTDAYTVLGMQGYRPKGEYKGAPKSEEATLKDLDSFPIQHNNSLPGADISAEVDISHFTGPHTGPSSYILLSRV